MTSIKSARILVAVRRRRVERILRRRRQFLRNVRRKWLRLRLRAGFASNGLSDGSGSGVSSGCTTFFFLLSHFSISGFDLPLSGLMGSVTSVFLGLRRFLGIDCFLLHNLWILRPVLARGRHRDAVSRLGKGFGIGREHERRPLGHFHVGLLAVTGQAHVVEHFALELDAATAAERKRGGESRRQKRRPAGARYGSIVPQGSPSNARESGLSYILEGFPTFL